MRKFNLIIITIISILVYNKNKLFAQAIPSSATISSSENDIIKELGFEEKKPSIEINTESYKTKKTNYPKEFETSKIKLKKIETREITAYTKKEINNLFKDSFDKEINIKQVYEFAEILTKKYKEDGYILSKVIVPPQNLKNGIIRLHGVEGYIESIDVKQKEGKTYDKELIETVKKLTEPITNQKPLNINVLEKQMLLANDLPGIEAKAVVSPAEAKYGAKLTVFVSKKNYNGSITIDNRGNDYMGPVRAKLKHKFNGIINNKDEAIIALLTTSDFQELLNGDLIYKSYIGTNGLHFKTKYTYSKSEPGGEDLKAFELKNSNNNFNIGLYYPIKKTRTFTSTLFTNFAYKNSSSEILGLNLYDDKIYTFKIGTKGHFLTSKNTYSNYEISLTKGLDILNATQDDDNKSRVNGTSDFLSINGYIDNEYYFNQNFSFYNLLKGQYSSSNLLSLSEFNAGGAEIGRGYDASEITGETGVGIALEIRYKNTAKYKYIKSYSLYGFYDFAYVENNDPLPGEEENQEISSAGIGLNIYPMNNFKINFELAKPLEKDVSSTGNKDLRVFGSINYFY